MNDSIRITLSNRHIHLSEDLRREIFGDKELTVRKYLTQSKREYAAEETVTIRGPKGCIENVRILGPCRGYTQVELLRSDTYVLGVNAPVRESGDLEGAADLTILCGGREFPVKSCGIIALRHIHMKSSQMEELGIQDRQMVSVQVGGERGLVFQNVLIRRSRSDESIMHVDTEEGNAAGLSNGDYGRVITDPVPGRE